MLAADEQGAVQRVHVTVIAKEPVPGKVKTRLCPPLLDTEAAELAAAALSDTFAAVEDTAAFGRDVCPVALIDGASGEWIPPAFLVHRQQGGGLGERLAQGFVDLGPGVVIGMDTPGGLAHLGPMIDAVRAGRDTIGLTVDGGYWAIGLSFRSNPDDYRAVFDSVPMSTGSTGIAQLRRLHQLGRPVTVAPMVHDLDRIGDLEHVVAEAPDSRLARVASVMRSDGLGGTFETMRRSEHVTAAPAGR